MNLTDYLLLGVILLVLILAVRKCIRDRKRGKTCGCGCEGCSRHCGK